MVERDVRYIYNTCILEAHVDGLDTHARTALGILILIYLQQSVKYIPVYITTRDIDV
jgi:hypothetical protein